MENKKSAGELFGLPEKPGKKFNFNADTLFGQTEEILFLAPNNLTHYHSHPFSIHSGKRMADLVESIKEHGIVTPVIVQPTEHGYYEILSGHNRVEAAKQAGIEKIPCIVKRNLSEGEAMLIVVESNLMQRSFADLKESEKAAIIWYRQEAMVKKKTRPEVLEEVQTFLQKTEEISTEMGQKTRDQVGAEYDLSGRTIARYLRIYECTDSVKELLDEGKIGNYAAVALSYLSSDIQEKVAQKVRDGKKVNLEKIQALRKLSEEELTEEMIESLLSEQKKSTEKEKKGTRIFLKKEISEQYFKGKRPEEMEEIIERALRLFFEKKGK